MNKIIIFFLILIAFLIGLNLNLRSYGFKPLCNFAGGKYIVDWGKDFFEEK